MVVKCGIIDIIEVKTLGISVIRSEEKALKKHEHIIKAVEQGSIAEELEIEPGDVLLTINNE